MTCTGCSGSKEIGRGITTAFQPIVDLETGGVYAYEALVRGRSGEGAAEVLSRVKPEDLYSFDQACRVVAIRNAVAAGLLQTEAKLSINFMPNAVYSPEACIQLTLNTAMQVFLPLRKLIFEFTEGEDTDSAHLSRIIDAYRALGFGTAIDDFGAGYSGLVRLADLNADALKLDMALVRGVDTSGARRTIVCNIVRMASELHMRVIAEGIETPEELEALKTCGVRYMQGYLFARPSIGRLPSPASHHGRRAAA